MNITIKTKIDIKYKVLKCLIWQLIQTYGISVYNLFIDKKVKEIFFLGSTRNISNIQMFKNVKSIRSRFLGLPTKKVFHNLPKCFKKTFLVITFNDFNIKISDKRENTYNTDSPKNFHSIQYYQLNFILRPTQLYLLEFFDILYENTILWININRSCKHISY